MLHLDSVPGSTVRVGVLDFSKAFDSVVPALLIGKMTSLGFNQWFTSWVWSFLSERRQRVRIQRMLSSCYCTSSGIPQGTVLGPTLFSIMIDDLQPVMPSTFITRYADDQTLSCPTSKDLQTDASFQIEFNNISTWCQANNMSLNEKKTKEIIISFTGRETSNIPLAQVEGEIIQRVENVKILGITIDNHLTWTPHLQDLHSKGRSLLYLLRRLRRSYSIPSSDMIYLIRTVMIPTLTYAYPAWCNVKRGDWSKIVSVIAKAYHISGVTFEESELNRTLESSLIHLLRKCLVPSHLLNHLVPSYHNHRFNTRRKLLHHIRSRTTKHSNLFILKAVRLFNNN